MYARFGCVCTRSGVDAPPLDAEVSRVPGRTRHDGTKTCKRQPALVHRTPPAAAARPPFPAGLCRLQRHDGPHGAHHPHLRTGGAGSGGGLGWLGRLGRALGSGDMLRVSPGPAESKQLFCITRRLTYRILSPAPALSLPLLQAVCGQLQLPYQGQVLDFGAPFARKTMHELVREKTGVDFEQFGGDLEVRALGVVWCGRWARRDWARGRLSVVGGQDVNGWCSRECSRRCLVRVSKPGARRQASCLSARQMPETAEPTRCPPSTLCRRRGRRRWRLCASTRTHSWCSLRWPRRPLVS